MNILILGGGGREHSLAWAVLQNPKCDRLIVAPGNAGTAAIAETAVIDILDAVAVVQFAADTAIDLVVVGSEAPLAMGVTDALRDAGIPVFGPNRAAAMVETSKTFTKELCAAVDAPTADWSRFTERADAIAHIAARGTPIVVKADGLAAGKGVVVATTRAEAVAAVTAWLRAPGDAVVIEAVLTGEEASFFVLVDGETLLAMGTAQDHKRAGEGDTGPNTGGMGAYSPAPVLTEAVAQRALETIVRPCMAELARRGTPYRGVLYAGLMIEDGVPSLVEFNARFGDPECQVLMLRLGAQALDLMQACAEGRLAGMRVQWAEDHAICVVMAAPGYPDAPVTGQPIDGLTALTGSSSQMVFHAGTVLRDGQVVSAGGRVLGLSARADTLRAAADRAYGMVDAVDWAQGWVRRDIGWRALRD